MPQTVITALIGRILKQQDKGLLKYGKEVAKENHSLLEWIEHDLEEKSDSLVYGQCQAYTVNEIIEDLRSALGATSMTTCHMHIDKALKRLGG